MRDEDSHPKDRKSANQSQDLACRLVKREREREREMSAKLAKTFLLAFAVAAAFQGALGARQARSERTWFGVENAAAFQGALGARQARSERTWFGVENATEVASPPSSYPLFKQCDPEWGSDYIKTKTICQVGCLMSSISMGLAGWKISLDGSPSNPGNLNNWLLQNDGYTDSNNLIEDALNALVPGMWSQSGMHTTNDISVDDLKDLMNHDYIVVANVMKGRHFVLATGYDGWDTVYVNDPGFDNTQYSYSQDVWGWRIFSMNN